MPNILIRGVPEEVVAECDLRAEQLGLSRNEFLKRKLLSDMRADFVYSEIPVVTDIDWKRSEALTDHRSPEEIREVAWPRPRG